MKMKKAITFLICLLAALAVDFLREGVTSRVYAQFVISDESLIPKAKGGYQTPDPDKLKSPYPASRDLDRASGSYPAPISRPGDKKGGGSR